MDNPCLKLRLLLRHLIILDKNKKRNIFIGKSGLLLNVVVMSHYDHFFKNRLNKLLFD